MSAIKIKENLLRKINSIEDEEILKLVKSFIDFETDAIYEVSAQQEEAIKIGLEQIKEGDVIDEEQLKKETDEWLRK